ncbi:MAG: PAS domain S-box protein [Planctomycetaceae bacterium]|nr:PAS domain S-box protein [Planctomycetaceae bacterium]
MKKINLNLTQKIIIDLTIVSIPLFLLIGLVIQRIFEHQVIRNAESYVQEIAAEETQQINNYMATRKLIGKKSAEFIEKKLTYEPTENDLNNFDKRYQYINGALRTNLKAFDNNDISAIFLSNLTPLDNEIEKIIIATEGCFDDYAKGVKGTVFNMYLITKQQLIRIYEKNWSLEIEPNHDFRKDEFYYIGDPQHNPERQSRWTQVYYDSIWKHWMTSLITPVYLKDEFLGIIGHDMILDNLYADVVSKKHFDTGYSFIFDSNKNIIVHPCYMDKLFSQTKMNTLLHCDITDKKTAEAVSVALQQSTSQGQTKLICLKADGHTNYFLARKLDFLNWYYGIMLPKDEMFKLLPEFRKRFIYTAILFSAAIYLTMVILIWRYVLQPVIKISKATEKIGQGNITYKIPCKSGDELGRLAAAFNKMTTDLQQRTTSIENLNSEIAERKNAEEALGQSEEKYRLQFEEALDAIFLADAETGILIDCNNAAAKLVGREKSELVGQDQQILHPSSKIRDDSDNTFEQHLRDKIGQVLETKVITKSGVIKNVAIKANLLQIGDKKILQGIFRDITESKKAEEALRRSETKFHTLYDTTSDAVMMMADGKFFDCNKATLEIYGCADMKEFCSKHPADLSPPKQPCGEDSLTLANKQIAIAMEKGTNRFEWVHKRADTGKEFIADVLINAMELDGKIVVHTVVRDITERKRAEEEISLIKTKLELSLQSSQMGMWQYNIVENKRSFDNQACSLLGINPAIFGGAAEEFFATVHPEDREKIKAALKQTIELNTLYEPEYRVVWPDGSIHHISARGKLLCDNNGNPQAINGIICDITARKRMEDEMKKMLQWQQGINILQQSLLAQVLLDDKLKTITDSIVKIFDADFCRIWLIRPGDKCQDCVHGEANEGTHVCRYRDKCLHLLASSGRYTHIDGKVHRRVPFGCYKIGLVASGEEHKFLTNDVQNDPRVHNNQWARELGLKSFAGYQLKVPGGETLGVLALFAKHTILPAEDAILDGLSNAAAFVVQQSVADEAIRQSKAELEQTGEQLIQTVDKLSETNQELKNFVYIASHDLREPLRKIVAFGGMLQKSLAGKLTDDDTENLLYMVDGATRMNKMIEGLLIYSRVSSQTQPTQTVDLNEIVKQLQQFELSVVLEEKHVVLDIPQPLPSVEVDPVQICQLIQNLIANGIKYQSKGSTPYITLTSKPAADGMVRVEVTDNGIGIKAEYIGSIFVMFKRLHTKSEYEGTGIGLSVCKKIVERHGGKIGVESQPGKGSIFWFTLPAANSTATINQNIQTTEKL